MYGTTITIEGNLATDLTIRTNRDGGTYADGIVLVNHSKDRPPTRWNIRITGRHADNATNLTKGDRLLIAGTVVTDTWTDKTTSENRYTQRVLVHSLGVSLTYARITGIERNTKTTETAETTAD